MKNLIALLLLILVLSLPKLVNAQSGCCSWHGGESYCDYSTNRWVCADGTYSPTCTCGNGYYSPPAYVPPPTCPLNSYWTGSSCTCYSGYISSGGSCISYQQYCWNTMGYSSQYNYGTGLCECMYGYVYSGGRCQMGDLYCSSNYGYNAQYDSSTKQCECRYGYIWNTSGTSCISRDDSCHNQLGLMSSYNSLNNTCDCFTGYVIIGGQCVPSPKVYVPVGNNRNPTIVPTTIQQYITATPKITITPNSNNFDSLKKQIEQQEQKKSIAHNSVLTSFFNFLKQLLDVVKAK